MADLGDICLRSRPLNGTDAVEIKIPVRSLAQELEDQIPRASAYKDLPKGRKRAGWKKDFLRNVQKAAADLGNISEEEILKTVREYRSGRKKLPEITVVARTKKKTASGIVDTSVLVAGIAGPKSLEITPKNPRLKRLKSIAIGPQSDYTLVSFTELLNAAFSELVFSMT